MGYVVQVADCRTSLSFPHASSGNPGEIGRGPPIETFGGDDLGRPISSPQPQFSNEYAKDTKLKESINFANTNPNETKHLSAFHPRLFCFVNFVSFVVQWVGCLASTFFSQRKRLNHLITPQLRNRRRVVSELLEDCVIVFAQIGNAVITCRAIGHL
jgi:hypothetical protein